MSYDAMMSPQALLERLVYGKPRPLLKPYQRLDQAFYGQLFDQLANQHAALVRLCTSRSSAQRLIRDLRSEIPESLYEVGAKQDPDIPIPGEYWVIVYNRITRQMREPAWHDMLAPTSEFVDTAEAARILHLDRNSALRLAKEYGAVDETRVGGRRQAMIRRDALPEMANRKGRHTRPRRTKERPL